jgi:hypothetical protein
VLSERQIEHLLESCERKLSKSLSVLRERLLRDGNPGSVIWELVLLHTFLGRFDRVEHEPGAGMPDLVVRGLMLNRLCVEAAAVTSPSAAELKHSSEFDSWLYRAVIKEGVPANGAHITVQILDATKEAEIPQKHRWGSMQKHPSWKQFIDQLRDRGEGLWPCPQGNIAVHFRTQQNGIVSSRPLVSDLPNDITKHPVYREIRAKARQIRNWPWRLRRQPIILAICIPERGREFSEHASSADYSVNRAVFSALLNHDRMNNLDRINILRQRLKWNLDGIQVEANRLRVSGSDLVSAVLIVRIKQDHTFGLLAKSKAKPELYRNPHARHPLSDSLESEVRRLNFNGVEYGPGRESWHNTTRGSLKQRNLRRGGTIEFRSGKQGDIELRIPTMNVLAILSGEKTAQEVFRPDPDRPPNPLTFFQKALASELTLQSIEVIEADPTTRAEQQLAFRFGEGKPAVVARAKEAKPPSKEPKPQSSPSKSGD